MVLALILGGYHQFMFQKHPSPLILWHLLIILILPTLACNPSFLSRPQPTSTPTKTPKTIAIAEAVPTDTPLPLPTDTDIPSEVPPTDTPEPEATQTPTPLPTETPTEVSLTSTNARPTSTPIPPPPTNTPEPTATSTPALDFVITEIRVMGLGENNGGIEGAGSGRTIFITVIDAAGNPIDGAFIVNTTEYPGEALSGDKGPGKAEILMNREVFRLKIDNVSGVPVTSQTSHNLSLMAPVPTDIVGKLGGPDYSNAACVTLDNCPLPPGKHYSYVIVFQRTY